MKSAGVPVILPLPVETSSSGREMLTCDDQVGPIALVTVTVPAYVPA
jgi:hypothetical protein